MNFSDSLSEFRFLSELYASDSPDAVLLAEYPSSNSAETRYQNTDKFIIHDPYPPPESSLLKVLGPHHLMYCWGDSLPVTSDIKPPDILIDHWAHIFGDDVRPHWQSLDEKASHITLFPHESLKTEQQEVDPEMLYAVHSKEALAHIDCPQAGFLESISPPCIIKLSHGYANTGNFFIHDEKDAQKAQAYIDRHWPDAKTVINELIEDIDEDYGVQFYLRQSGEIVWLGFTEQIFNKQNRWAGGRFSAKIQDKLYPEFIKIARPVAEYLHQNGYYGVVGIDILQNNKGELFLVDLNPRLTGITPFLTASRLFSKEEMNEGIYCPSLPFPGTLAALIETVENIQDAKVAVLSAYEDLKASKTLCHISVNAPSFEICQKIMQNLSMKRNTLA